ncbi:MULTISPECIES: Na+/H+ antiporter NhaC family protein [Fictibacillus]|uniref:Na+/H+ antiporter NhaC family protein n=1 Tax=Fictibacillus TaxID=1329200 RepID=UPI0018CFC1E7|nr:Na+/H+ antiporter NhaC family protein [Fictibacillus sp. 26RED30]MBH0159554.1 Na+/H+ antiporter NhaC family protein [Fictibacillus sp. 26RED30]
MEFENSIYSLIPPVLAILMVVLTRRVLVSLGAGILAGALLLHDFSIVATLKEIGTIVKGHFISDGALNEWNVYILLFLLILGMMTSIISLAGGSRAFGEWAISRVKTRRGAQLLTVVFGLVIFIDDYFNSLAVGNVSRPITDRHRISRAKLAYYLDSTAAPVCVISPVSSWGAYIIGIIGTIFATHEITNMSAFSAFIQMIPMNFYAVFALILVFAVAYFQLDFGPMKKHEETALATGEVIAADKKAAIGEGIKLEESDKGKVGDLVWPIVILIISTVGFMIYTGIQNVKGLEEPTAITLLSIFENTDVPKSLVYGGLLGLASAILFFLPKKMGAASLGKGLGRGIQSMIGAVTILLFAWTIISIIDSLGTGTYLAGLVDQHMNLAYLPFVLFVLSGLMAFATGTSWGTFGVMLPIAAEISASTNIELMLPVLAAVLAGSVFGDHCSPISDTTILSSTGAGSHHIDHVMTQLPYSLVAAGVSAVGYLALGFTESVWIGLFASAVIFILALFLIKKVSSKNSISDQSLKA